MRHSVVFASGIAYLQWYKWRVLVKVCLRRLLDVRMLRRCCRIQMENAFDPGYDPALELAVHSAKARRQVGQDGQRLDLELEIGDAEPWTQYLRRKEQDVIDLIVKGEEAGHYYVLLGAKVT